jgi:hypothetical protein
VKYKITATEMNAGRNMWSGEMMKALGLKPGGHLPSEGLPEREIQGIRVYVKPATPTKITTNVFGTHIWKSSKHRVIAICPGCERHLSAGRLHQHICKTGGQGQ